MGPYLSSLVVQPFQGVDLFDAVIHCHHFCEACYAAQHGSGLPPRPQDSAQGHQTGEYICEFTFHCKMYIHMTVCSPCVCSCAPKHAHMPSHNAHTHTHTHTHTHYPPWSRSPSLSSVELPITWPLK